MNITKIAVEYKVTLEFDGGLETLKVKLDNIKPHETEEQRLAGAISELRKFRPFDTYRIIHIAAISFQ